MITKYLNYLYNNINFQKKKEANINLTYGEILPNSVTKMFTEINPNKDDVFYDFGSGFGKVVIQSYLLTPIKKSMGIEIVENRNIIAEQAKERLINGEHFKSKYKSIQFIQDDFFNVDTSDGTIFYLCSTCFENNLMNQLYEKITKSPNLIYILTLKPFERTPTNPRIPTPKNITVPTSRNNSGLTCYIYNFA